MSAAPEPPAGQAAPEDVEVARAEADPPADSPGGIDLEFRPDIEGLRAVAVLLVVLYHAGVKRLAGGFVGVDVFFVISGFLITGLLLRERERRGRVSIVGFYARRARRILPAGMLVLIGAVVMAYHYQNFLDFPFTKQAARWAALFAANIHFAQVGTDYNSQNLPPSPILHYWSLGVEEQFYLVWPTIVLLAGLVIGRGRSLRWPLFTVAVLGSVASFLWAIHMNHTNATAGFFSPFTRAWELGLGALAATVIAYGSRLNKWAGVALAWAGMAAILYAGLVFTDPDVSPGPPLLIPVLGTLAVIVGGASGIGAGHLLSTHPMRAVGRVSYGWYLLHYPPMILLAGALYHPLPVHEDLVIAAVTLGVAFAMYYALEKPIRRSAALARRPWASIAMGLAFVAAAFLVATLLTKGFSY